MKDELEQLAEEWFMKIKLETPKHEWDSCFVPVKACDIHAFKAGYTAGQAKAQEQIQSLEAENEHLYNNNANLEAKYAKQHELNRELKYEIERLKSQSALKIKSKRIIQIAAAAYQGRGIFALCDDGTLWEKVDQRDWEEIALPAKEGEE